MLDIDTIKQLHDLSADTLYGAEVAHLPRISHLSRTSQRALFKRARRGDEQSRHTLILHCLHFVLMKAHTIYRNYQPAHIDLLDLVALANLAMVEKLDKALATERPIPYLLSIASWEMQRYCIYHAPLIQRPEYPNDKLARLNQSPEVVESLDEPIDYDGKRFHVELIEAPALLLDTEEEQEQYRFTPLYQAVKQLNPKQRATIIRLYGLFGQPAQTLADMAKESQLPYEYIASQAKQARNRLRVLLAGHLEEMLTQQPEREEE